jgi:aminopeptidase N
LNLQLDCIENSNLTFPFALIGYYRVDYDQNNWNRLINYLKDDDYTKIPPVNRAQLLDDSLNLARAGAHYRTALALAQYLDKEEDYIPWLAALNGFAFLNLRLTGTEDYELFKVKQLH